MELHITLGEALQAASVVFAAGVLWAKLGALKKEVSEMKEEFTKSIDVLTAMVANHHERIIRLEEHSK